MLLATAHSPGTPPSPDSSFWPSPFPEQRTPVRWERDGGSLFEIPGVVRAASFCGVQPPNQGEATLLFVERFSWCSCRCYPRPGVLPKGGSSLQKGQTLPSLLTLSASRRTGMACFSSANRSLSRVLWGRIDLPVWGGERESVCDDPLLHEWTFWPSVQTAQEPQG